VLTRIHDFEGENCHFVLEQGRFPCEKINETCFLMSIASAHIKTFIYLERIRGMDQVPLGLIVGKCDITFIPKVIEIAGHSIMPPCKLTEGMLELPNDFPYDCDKKSFVELPNNLT
jgi:hypothetical protein